MPSNTTQTNTWIPQVIVSQHGLRRTLGWRPRWLRLRTLEMFLTTSVKSRLFATSIVSAMVEYEFYYSSTIQQQSMDRTVTSIWTLQDQRSIMTRVRWKNMITDTTQYASSCYITSSLGSVCIAQFSHRDTLLYQMAYNILWNRQDIPHPTMLVIHGIVW